MAGTMMRARRSSVMGELRCRLTGWSTGMRSRWSQWFGECPCECSTLIKVLCSAGLRKKNKWTKSDCNMLSNSITANWIISVPCPGFNKISGTSDLASQREMKTPTLLGKRRCSQLFIIASFATSIQFTWPLVSALSRRTGVNQCSSIVCSNRVVPSV